MLYSGDLLSRLKRKIENDIQKARRNYDITKVIRAEDGRPQWLLVSMPGVIGSGLRTKITYQLWVNLNGYPNSCPTAWVESPSDMLIRHYNIWHPRPPYNKPEICVSEQNAFQEKWTGGQIAVDERDIALFLRQVFYVLNNENPRSAARR